jgi:predicted dienelactone hydrolase
MITRAVSVFVLAALAAACGDDPSTSPPVDAPLAPSSVEAPGPYPVGTTTVTLTDAARDRSLRVEIWYPATEAARATAAAGAPIEEFVPAGPERDQLAALVAAAPDPGTSRRSHAARDAEAATGGPWAVVAFSHCYNCTRYSTFAVAERLASHGIAVVAPDHAGGTLPDQLAGTAQPIGVPFLETRAADIRFVLDRVLDAQAAELPATLRGRFDAARVGVFGHSFGGVTTGLVLMNDARPKAGLAIAVPMENPLLPAVSLAQIHVPLLFFLATEDHSIGPIGNTILRQNFTNANPPVTMVEVADAGHWSFSNICGLIPDFAAGCAAAPTREGDGTPFEYVDIDAARGLTQAYVTAFFKATLMQDAEADAFVDGPARAAFATVQTRR